MKILVFSSLSFKKHAGPTYSVPNQVKSLMKKTDVIWVNISDYDVPNDYKDLLLSFKTDEIKEACKLITNDIDFVIFEEFHKAVYLKIYKILLNKGIKYSIVPRGQMTAEYNNHKIIKKFFGNFLFFNKFKRNASFIQFLTQQEKDDSKDRRIKNSVVIPNGIIIPDKKKSFEIKDRVKFTFIGRYNIFQKGIDFLFDNISKLNILTDCYEFNLYGPDSPSGNRKEIEECAEKYGVKDKVIINGPIFDNDKEEVLLDTDVFILTSRFEGLPMSVLEALAYGIPVLVTKGTNLGEAVEKYNAGWYVSNDDIAECLAKIINNKNDVSFFYEKSKNAVEMAKQYSWDCIASDTISYVSTLLRR